MGFIHQLDQATYEEQVAVYKALQDKLLEVFSFDTYTNVEDLRQDFQSLMLDPYYSVLLEDFANSYPQYSIDPNDLFRFITPKRWKLCKVCKKPYLDNTVYNKSKICYNKTYKRYSLRNRDYFISTGEKSLCYMEYKRKGFHKYKSEKQDDTLSIEG